MAASRPALSVPPCPHDCRHEPLLGHDDPPAAPPAHHAAHHHDPHHGHDHVHAHTHDSSHAHHDHSHGHGHDHGHADSHGHGHDHAHAHLKHQHSYRHHDKRILLIAFTITAVTMVAEVVGGWLTHSLALVSDGIHMFTHAFALGLSWAAIVLAARPANAAKTFGYYRVEVIAAFVNGITILISAAWIVMEGIARLITPEPVAIGATLAIAVAGLVVNLITGAILMRGDQGNLNIRSAFLHMLTDTLSSVAIIIGLVVIHFTTWQWIDPLLALLVAVIIVKWSWSLITQSLNVLMEGSTVDVGVLTAHVLAEFPEVVDLHDVHVWQIAEHFNCLTAHVTIRADSVTGYTALVQRINASLKQNFEIGHTNLQPEFA